MTIREKVKEIYLDKSLWKMTPPSVRTVAKKANCSVGTAHLYIKELDVVSKFVL